MNRTLAFMAGRSGPSMGIGGRRRPFPAFLGLLLALLGGAGFATGQGDDESHRIWNLSLVAYSGMDQHWTSPSPVDTTYERYYSRLNAISKVDAQVFGFWTNIRTDRMENYGEMAGPIPPEGIVLLEQRISYADANATVEADVKAWISGDGYFHVDVTHFTSTTPLRITLTGTVKVRAVHSVYGDVNADGRLDALDEALYARYLAEGLPWLAVPLEKSDLDCDGLVTLLDGLQLAQYLAGNTAAAYTNWDFTD